MELKKVFVFASLTKYYKVSLKFEKLIIFSRDDVLLFLYNYGTVIYAIIYAVVARNCFLYKSDIKPIVRHLVS